MSNLKILVVGASIAGPCAAYWLTKTGAKVTVIERFPSLRTGGQAVDIRTAGVSVMRKMAGMEAAVREAFTQEEGISFVRDDGRPWGVIRATGNPEQQGLISEYEIFRGDLSRVLVNLTKEDENIDYIFNEQITSIQHSSSGVDVDFLNGTPQTTYDLIVACDGATSRTRAMAFECSVREHMHPVNSWAAYFTINPDLLNGSKIGQALSAPGGRFFSIGNDPSGGNRVMFMCVNQSDTSMDEFRAAASKGDETLKHYVANQYRNVGWKSAEVLQNMTHSPDFYASEIAQVKLPSLHTNRIVFVGDAGYAAGPTGGGTSLALTGGYMLAGALLSHPSDLDAGLQAYEDHMAPLLKEMQKIPPFVGTIMAPQTRLGIAVRNWIFAFVAWTGVAEFLQKYLGSAFADSKEFPLPSFEWVR
jgi:2-polyprenyl-6-methoxyphenol hydroxylase-like FAD-dependent oxidoreductase